jgi:CheY-like chemotaxis protein
MVGEIRDNEVAEIVGQAAYTGHLVLSTLHTTDAASAITRLVNLGLQPFKIAESLNAVVAQRLLRRLCPGCATVNDDATAKRLGEQHGVPRVGASVGRGCDRCKQTGYIDRMAVPELLIPDDRLRAAIRNGAGVADIRNAMRAAGSPSMRETAVGLVGAGILSIEEVDRVLSDHSDDGSMAVAVEAAAPVVAAAPPAITVTAPAAAPRAAVKRKILVADDDRMTRLLMRMLLEKDGFTVIEAENGALGMAALRSDRPDLMIVDLQMPDMDGFQVLDMIRGDQQLASLPVLVLTSESGTDVESKVLEMGADDYLVKPFEPEVMIARIRAAFRRAARSSA